MAPDVHQALLSRVSVWILGAILGAVSFSVIFSTGFRKRPSSQNKISRVGNFALSGVRGTAAMFLTVVAEYFVISTYTLIRGEGWSAIFGAFFALLGFLTYNPQAWLFSLPLGFVSGIVLMIVLNSAHVSQHE